MRKQSYTRTKIKFNTRFIKLYQFAITTYLKFKKIKFRVTLSKSSESRYILTDKYIYRISSH